MSSLRYESLFALLAVAVATGCGGAAPLESAPGGGDAHSTIRFSLAGARTSAGLFLCEETDAASLRVSPLTRVATLHRRALTGEPDCTVEFRVTVPRGEVGFFGELQGGERPLMRGAVPRFQARDDGFVVVIDLNEIDALDVETRTIGLGGPASYAFEVEGSPTPFPIGTDDRDTVAAIAGGPRLVTLHPEPCVVVNGPARREVMIPSDERQLGDALFEIDCTAGGDLTIITTTKGSPSGPATYDLHMPDGTRHPVGGQDSLVIGGVTPGPISDVWIETNDPNCVAFRATPEPWFLPTAGQLRLEFVIRCGISGGPGANPGPGPTATALAPDSLRVVALFRQPPLPGEIPTFDVTVADAGSWSRTRALTVADSVTFVFGTATVGPYTAALAPTGSCRVYDGISSQSVNISSSGFARVEFVVGC